MYNVKLSHVRLNVRDLEKAIVFYTRILHLGISERVGEEYAFLSNNDCHHVLALQKVGGAPGDRGTGVGVDHIAFEVPGVKSFARAYLALSEAGIPVKAVDNAISWSLYFDDPEGNELEIFWDTRYESHGAKRWQGTRNTLQPGRILNALKEKHSYVVPPPSSP